MASLFSNWAYRLSPPRRVERILLNLLLPIGDTLFATPTIRAVRKRFPQAQLTALVFPTNAGILRANEDIDEIVLHPTGQTFRPLEYLRFFRQMQRRRFDIALEFRPYAWYLSVLCGVWRRLSFDIPVYQWFLPLGPRPWKHRHAIESYASVVQMLGLRVDPSCLVVCTTDKDRTTIAGFLAGEGVHPHERLIALHPGGEGFRGMKRWEPARFAVLGDRLAEDYAARTVIVGGRDELPLAREVAARMRTPPLIANGRVSLGQSVALLERCMLFVGNDSAPLHMAGSLGIPTVGIFGPTSTRNYAPVGPFVEIARSDLVCSPCFFFVGSQPVWDTSHCRVPTCLHALSIDAVRAAAQRAITRHEAHLAEPSFRSDKGRGYGAGAPEQ